MPASSIPATMPASRNGAPDAGSGQFSLPLGQPDERVLRGRAEFLNVFSDLARGKRNWQLACFLSLGTTVVLAAGVVAQASRSRLVPYVVEVDRLGRARAFGSAERMERVDQRVLVAQLAGFVRDVRTVVSDPAAQAELVRRAYAFVDQGAAPFLGQYYASPANDPRMLGRDMVRLVEVTSVLPVPGGSTTLGSGTWKVAWVESIYPRTPGASRAEAAWEAYVTTRIVPPATLDRIRINPIGLYVTSIAMLVAPDARLGEEVFWTEEARALLVGLVLHVAANEPAEPRTLTRVRALLSRPPDEFRLVLDEMLESDAVGGLVARSAARIVQKADRERSGVVSSAQSYTHFLDSPRMVRTLGRSSFALGDLKRSSVTLYLILPPDRMDAYRGWLRVMIASALLAMTRDPEPPKQRVLFLLDEFANLGRMRPVERAVSLAAAYGAPFWLLLQDLAQLRGTYPDRWQTFLANADVLQAFGVNDWETAELISKLTGEATIEVESENETAGVTRGRNTSRQESAAWSVAEKGRRLLLPDEVRRLAAHEQLLFARGSAPVRARRIDYLRDAEYAGLFDENPMHRRGLAVVSA